MGCKFEYKGKWYEEADLKELWDNEFSTENSGSMSVGPGIDSELPSDNSTSENLAFKGTNTAMVSDPGKMYNSIEGNTESSKASASTIAKVREWLKIIGVDIKGLDTQRFGGVNGVAIILDKLIQIANGREDVALTEEAMHFAVEILERTNPTLFKSMMNKIGNYQMFSEVMEEYGKHPNYQTKDGKPDIPKLKKEAVGKVLAEYFIQHNEGTTEKPELLAQTQSWWEKILNWFGLLSDKAGFNPFEQAVTDILGEGIGDASVLDGVEGEYMSLSQDAVYNKISDVDKGIDKKLSPTQVDENGKPRETYWVAGREIGKRVTDKVKAYYEKLFGNRLMDRTDRQKAIDTLKAEKGTDGHKDLEHAFGILVKDGKFVGGDIDATYKPKTNAAIYKILFENLKERLESFGDSKFLSEVRIVDEKNDVAGSVDLLVIKPDGKIQIIDWKFLEIDPTRSIDVPWFKQNSWNIQIAEYKRILAESYGIPTYDIKGEAIPIQAVYKYTNAVVNGVVALPTLGSIKIGDVDVKKIEEDHLLPVRLTGQTTDNKDIDKLIAKLNALHANIENTDAIDTEDKIRKAEQLQAIDKAVRHLSVRHVITPLLDQADIYTKDVKAVIEKFNNTFKGADYKKLSKKDLSDYGTELDRALDQIRIYTSLDIELSSLTGTDVSEDAEKQAEKLGAVVSRARFLEKALTTVIDEFGDAIALSVGFEGITDEEVQVRANERLFSGTSKIQLTTLQTYYKIRREAQNKADVQTNEENLELERISKDYEKLATSKGLNNKNLFSMVMNYAKNKLIDQFKAEFYDTLKKTVLPDKDIKWIKENIDIEEYKKALAEKQKTDIERIESRTWETDRKNKEIAKTKELYSTAKSTDAGWYSHYHVMKQFPIADRWTSEEWKTLNAKGNEPARALYDWVRTINDKAEKVGYIPDKASARTFLPWVVKSFAETVYFGGKLTMGEEFIRNMTMDEDTVGYGAMDLSGKLINKIPKYFTRKTDKEASTNLIKNLAMHNEFLNRYVHLSETEGIAKTMVRIEKNKGSIATDSSGIAKLDERGDHVITSDNTVNINLVERQLGTLLYGQKYVSSEAFDQTLGKVGKTFEKINKFIGFKLFPENLSERQFSMNKSVDTLNKFFQLKALGFNPLSAISNLVGGNLQMVISAGTHMTKADVTKAHLDVMSSAISGEQGKKLWAALKYFMPYTGNDVNQELERNLSLTKLTEHNIQDALMWMMRNGDKYVQAVIFTSLWNNTLLINGELVNARAYARSNPEFKIRYNNGTLVEKEANFNKVVEELLEKHGLAKQATIVDERLVIPGVDRSSAEAFALRNLSQGLSQRATGNMTPNEIRGINQNVWGASFMVFKNWIPALVDVRFGKLKYASDVEAYEWGRTRTVARVMYLNGFQGLKTLTDLLTFNAFSLSASGQIVKGTAKGIETLAALYDYKAKDYFDKTGKKFKMDREEFYDMVRQNIRNQAKDTLITITMLSMFFAAKALPDDEEDPEVKNRYKFMVRTLDKLSDEVSFYYSPNAFQQIMNGSGIMPSIGIFSDATKVISHTMRELYGAGWDQEVQDKNYVIKYLLRSFPVTSQMSSYLPLFVPDLATELGIRMPEKARR